MLLSFYWTIWQHSENEGGKCSKRGIHCVQRLYYMDLLYLDKSTITTGIHLRIRKLSKRLRGGIHTRLSAVRDSRIAPSHHFHTHISSTVHRNLGTLNCCRPAVRFSLHPPPGGKQRMLVTGIAPNIPILVNNASIMLHNNTQASGSCLGLLSAHPTVNAMLGRNSCRGFGGSLADVTLHGNCFSDRFAGTRLNVTLNLRGTF